MAWTYDAGQCTFCGKCAEYCPVQALHFKSAAPVVTGDRSLHHTCHQVESRPCTRCGAPVIPLPDALLRSLYGETLPADIAASAQLCERCRARLASQRIKQAYTGK